MDTLTRSEHIMGTTIALTIRSDRNASMDIETAFQIFRSYEVEFSRFLPHSDLSILNREKNLVPSSRFLKIITLCDRLFYETEGIFNPLIDLRQIGYSESFEKGNFEAIHEEVNIDWEKVSFSPENIRIGAHQHLDLGGIVKGYSVDEVRDFFFMRGYTDFIINAGGDIYLAGSDQDGSWKVGVDNPFDPDSILATLAIQNGSISTSGTYKRKWESEGIEHHHIIDPRDQSHPREIVSISVIGQHTWMTDAYATISLIKGVDESIVWLEGKGLDAIIVSATGEIYTTKGLGKYSPTLFT